MHVLSKMEGSSSRETGFPCRASLLGIPAEMFQIIYQDLDIESKKNLRLVHTFLLARCRGIEKILLKLWSFRILTADQLILLADQVVSIEGLMITNLLGDRTAAEAGLQHLFTKHPELKVVEIMNSNCTDYALRLIVNRLQIVVLRLRNCSMTGDSGLNLRPRAESRVQVLDLAFSSGISDKILDFLNSIGTKSLKRLNLSHTDVEIFNAHFPALEELDLTGCRNLEAEGLKLVLRGTHATLKKLNLHNANIKPTDTRDFVDCRMVLEELNLQGCLSIPRQSTIAFINMAGKTLKKLNISQNQFHVPESLLANVFAADSLPVLEDLNLAGCNLQDSAFIALLNTTGKTLRKLNISENRTLTLANTSSLNASFPNLEKIDAHFCFRLTDEGVLNLLSKTGARHLKEINLSNCYSLKESNIVLLLCMVGQSLKKLNLSGTTLTWQDYHTYVNLPVIESIDVTLCTKLTDEALLHMLAIGGGSLKKLNLSGTSVSLPSSLASPKPKLEELFLVGCKNLDEANVILFISEFSATLKHLRLGDSNVALSEVGALADSFPVLEHLDFIMCGSMLVSSVITFLNKTGRTLKKLSLGDLKLTQADVESISTGFPVLEGLNLINNTHITDKLLVSLLNKMGGSLSKLFVRGASGVKKSTIQANFPKLNIVS